MFFSVLIKAFLRRRRKNSGENTGVLVGRVNREPSGVVSLWRQEEQTASEKQTLA